MSGRLLLLSTDVSSGGNINGHINEKTYDPEGLIHQSMENGLPVVYAAMNYRLSSQSGSVPSWLTFLTKFSPTSLWFCCFRSPHTEQLVERCLKGSAFGSPVDQQ